MVLAGPHLSSLRGVFALATYVGQNDIHLPLLSVRETFQFAKDTWNGTEPPGYNSVMDAAHQRKVNNVLKLLGLEHCADTPVGNNLIRGVSGGEKKRVTFGEMLMANFRVMLMDEISTGLDAAATVDIVRNITLASKFYHATYMVSLLQPAPEVVELFDDVMLMREGQIVYHGPQAEMVPYFEEMGLTFFNDQAVADFLSEFLADPLAVYARQVTRLREEGLPIPNHVPPTNTGTLVGSGAPHVVGECMHACMLVWLCDGGLFGGLLGVANAVSRMCLWPAPFRGFGVVLQGVPAAQRVGCDNHRGRRSAGC